MSKFLKQSDRLKAWSAKFKITAGQSLDKYKLVNCVS